jgi:hypothetical protein
MKFIRILNDYHNANLIKSAKLSYEDRGAPDKIAVFTIYFSDGFTQEYVGSDKNDKLLGLNSFNEWTKQMP